MGAHHSREHNRHASRKQQSKHNQSRHQLQAINSATIQQNVQRLFNDLQGGSRVHVDQHDHETTDTISFVQHGGLDQNVVNQLKQAMSQIDGHDVHSDLELSATSPFMVNPAHVLKGGNGSSSSSSSSSGSSSSVNSYSSDSLSSSSALPTTVQNMIRSEKPQLKRKPTQHRNQGSSSSSHSNSSSTSSVSTASSSSSSSSNSGSSSHSETQSSHDQSSSESTQVHHKGKSSKKHIFHKNEDTHSESSINIVPFYSSESNYSNNLRRYSQRNRRFI